MGERVEKVFKVNESLRKQILCFISLAKSTSDYLVQYITMWISVAVCSKTIALPVYSIISTDYGEEDKPAIGDAGRIKSASFYQPAIYILESKVDIYWMKTTYITAYTGTKITHTKGGSSLMHQMSSNLKFSDFLCDIIFCREDLFCYQASSVLKKE